MPNSAGVEVGRISVKVSPDTRQFRRELKKQLEGIEKSLGDGEAINTDLDVDTDKASKKVTKAKEEMGRKPIKLKTDISELDKFASKMKSFNDNFKSANSQRLKDIYEAANIRGESNRIIQEYERVRDAAFKANNDVAHQMSTSWRNALDPKILQDRIRRVFGRQKPIEIPVDFGNTKGGGGGGGGGGKNGIAAFAKGGGGGGSLDGLPSFGSGINPAGYAAILAGISLVAAPLIGLVTTALLTLPGLVSLIAAPIAAVTLGLDGFKKAAEAIKPQFDDLKATMSAAAETEFTPVLKNLADTVFPRLKAALPSVTAGLAQFAQGAVDAFNQGDNGIKFENSIRRIGDAFAGMKTGLQGFVSGFIGLIDQFSLKLPAITEWFNKAGTDFDAWVAKISGDGSLSTAFDQLGETIKKVLGFIGDLGKKGLEFMGKPGSLDGFLATLGKIGDAIQKVVDLSAKLNENWQNLVQGARAVGIFDDILGGDLTGAFNNAKDLATNKDWNAAANDARNLQSAIAEAGAEAEKSKAKVSDLLTGGNATAPGPAGGNPLQAIQDNLAPPEPIVVKPPDTAPAEAKITEYQSFIDSVTQQVRGSLTQATSGESLPAPNFDSFKAAWASLPGVVDSAVANMKNTAYNAVQGVVQVFQVGGNQIVAAVQQWPGAIAQALAGLYGAGATAGNQLVAGLVAGISGGISSVTAAARALAAAAKTAANAELGIKSPSRVFQAIGDYAAQGLGKGLEDGTPGVLEQAKALADKLTQAFKDGVDLTGITDTDLKSATAALEMEKKRLKLQQDMLPESDKQGRKDLKMQMDKLQAQKDAIAYEKDQNKSSGSSTKEDPFAKAAAGLAAAPVNFAKATGQQFLSDIGIGGNGLISKAITEGIQYVFNIGSVDEALSVKDRTERTQAMTVTGAR